MARSFLHLTRDLLDGDPWLTTGEVAGLMRVSRQTVARWTAAGRFPDTPDGRPGVIRTPGHVRGDYRIRESVVRGLLDGTLQPREGRR